jgi:hypothetical protein
MDEAELCEQWPEDTKKSPKLKGDFQARVRSGQMVPMVVRQQGWTALAVDKDTQEQVRKNTLGSQGTY